MAFTGQTSANFRTFKKNMIQKVSIRGFNYETDPFPIRKCAIFRKFEEVSGNARRHTAACCASDSAE